MVVHLPQSPLPMQKASVSLNRELWERITMVVHCSVPGCRWQSRALNVDDACEVLSDHLMRAHAEGSNG